VARSRRDARGGAAARLAIVALGALSCAQSRPPSAPEPGDPGEAGAGAPGDSRAEPMSEDGYYRALAAAECALQERCCARAGLRIRTGCAEELEPKLRTWRPDPSSGARFDPEAAAACVNGFAAIECVHVKIGRSDPPACARIYAHGRQPLGARCVDSAFECAPVEGEIVTCTPTSLTADEGICLIYRQVAEGDHCGDVQRETNSELNCRRELLCDDQRLVCVPRAERGEPCLTGYAWGDTCAEGSVCDRLGSKRCVEPAPIGSACDGGLENLCEGHLCVAGQCREPLWDMLYCER
jgi:hypothetical protein